LQRPLRIYAFGLEWNTEVNKKKDFVLCSTGLVKDYVAVYNGYHFTKCREFLEQLHENDSGGLLSSSVNVARIDWFIYTLNTRRE
jgi:hypothetical protein